MSRMIELKFEINDIVYIKGERFPCEIDLISLDPQDPETLQYSWTSYDRGPEETEVWNDGTFMDDDIGKTVFATYEELAEAYPSEYLVPEPEDLM